LTGRAEFAKYREIDVGPTMRTKPVSRVKKIAVLATAFVCIVLGLLTVWTPLPTGVALLAVGTFLLVSVSPTARRMMHNWRRRSDRVDRALAWIEDRAHRNVAVPLRRTRPLERKKLAKLAKLAKLPRIADIG
jgi:hypothetical protein